MIKITKDIKTIYKVGKFLSAQKVPAGNMERSIKIRRTCNGI